MPKIYIFIMGSPIRGPGGEGTTQYGNRYFTED